MNWGYPRTWNGFMHAVFRGQYEKISPTNVFTENFIHQLGSYATELRAQFWLPVALLGFIPFAGWSLKIGDRRRGALMPAIGLATVAVLLIAVEKFGGGTTMGGKRPYMLLIAGIFALLGTGVVALIIAEVKELLEFVLRPSGEEWGFANWFEKMLVWVILGFGGLLVLAYEIISFD